MEKSRAEARHGFTVRRTEVGTVKETYQGGLLIILARF